jgi:hypothetical protein
MLFDWPHFITEHASAIFGLIGTLAGGVLSFAAMLFLKQRDFNLKIADKLIERRIKAHEQVIAVALEMRVMATLGGFNQNGEVRRMPQVLISKEEFERWFTRFTQLTLEGSTWLSNDAKREVSFVQDYLVTLHLKLATVPSGKYVVIGEYLPEDFRELSSSLEKKAFSFFERGIRKLKLDSLDKWHKYKRPVTESRLQQMALIRNWPQIANAIGTTG